MLEAALRWVPREVELLAHLLDEPVELLWLPVAQQLLRVAAGQALHELGFEPLVEAPLLALETGLLGFRTFPLRERVSE